MSERTGSKPYDAQGISDAFHDAKLCAAALDAIFTGTRPFDDAMDGYQSRQDDRIRGMYQFTMQIGSLERPHPSSSSSWAPSLATRKR